MNQDYKTSAGDHPITPPPELVEQLRHASSTWLDQITIAYQAGADQELEACCEWLREFHPGGTEQLRTARRPKPPSLKERLSKAIIDGDEREALKLLEALDD